MAYSHISLVLVLILIGTRPLLAQYKEAATFLQTFDAEIAIPEEDIILIDEILKGQWLPGKELTRQIMKLSILKVEDEQLLKGVTDRESLLAIAKIDDASDFLKHLVLTINKSVPYDKQAGDVFLNQYMVFNDDTRYRWKINYGKNDYSTGLIVERDPGERKLVDHLSGYFIKKSDFGELLLGDYQIVTGYGLWSWRSVSTRKSFETISGLSRIGRGISPYRSSNEAWYIRGFGYSKETKFGNLLLSGGYTHQDGKLDSLGNLLISRSGLHTGATSIEQQNNVTESLILGQWHYNRQNTNIVTSVAGVKWQDKIDNTSTDWSGSVAFNSAKDNIIVFGEIGRGYNSTKGVISGLTLKVPNVKYLISSRYYSAGYSALRSNPFAEWVGNDRNELGIFQSISYKHKRHIFTVYGDISKTIDVENNDSFPKLGQEAGLRWEKRKGRQYQRIQWTWEKKSLEELGSYLLEQQPNYETGNALKYSIVSNLSKSIWGKLQLIYSSEETTDSKSTAYGIDTQVWWEKNKLTVFLDLVTTIIEGGDAWIYFWDVNLPGEMTTRVYTKDSISPAVKFLYRTNSGFEVGFRIRAHWKEFDFTGTPEIYGALVLEALL